MNTYNIKNLLSLVCLVSLSLLSFSCGEDDTPPAESTNDDLNGVWLATSYQQSGLEQIPTIFTSLELTFTKDEADSGNFTAVSTNVAGISSTAAASYTVVDDGNRIKIGTDTLDLTSSSSNLTLEGNILFSQGMTSISATKQ